MTETPQRPEKKRSFLYKMGLITTIIAEPFFIEQIFFEPKYPGLLENLFYLSAKLAAAGSAVGLIYMANKFRINYGESLDRAKKDKLDAQKLVLDDHLIVLDSKNPNEDRRVMVNSLSQNEIDQLTCTALKGKSIVVIRDYRPGSDKKWRVAEKKEQLNGRIVEVHIPVDASTSKKGKK